MLLICPSIPLDDGSGGVGDAVNGRDTEVAFVGGVVSHVAAIAVEPRHSRCMWVESPVVELVLVGVGHGTRPGEGREVGYLFAALGGDVGAADEHA